MRNCGTSICGLDLEIAARGLTANFVFHDWIPQALMPEYYSLGQVTLALGNFVESFGNAVYESLGCGTPVVVSRISSHRELLPEHLVDKVDFDDVVTAAQKAADIITNSRCTAVETVNYLHQHYSIERQLAAYAGAILSAECVPELPYRFRPINETTRFALPIWCYPSARGIYHDFRGDYQLIEGLKNLLRHFPEGFSVAEAKAQNVDEGQVMNWYRDGYVYPIYQ